tara:strand:- start:1557 stop:2567 length:1011 start_codon:yes stop_codon:yes gene_type:complete
MSRILENVSHLKEHPEIIRTLDFTQKVYEATYQQQSIVVKTEEILSLYSELLKVYDEGSFHDYLTRGFSRYEELKNQGKKHSSITAYTIHRITDMLSRQGLSGPHWIPELYQIDNPEGPDALHNSIYLFNWYTVLGSTIPSYSIERMMVVLEQIKKNKHQNSPAANFVEELQCKIKNGNTSEPSRENGRESASLDILSGNNDADMEHEEKQPFNSSVEAEIELATTFIHIKTLADDEGIGFSLSLQELNKILADKLCSFTGAKIESNEKFSVEIKEGIECVDSESILFFSEDFNQLKKELSNEDRIELIDAISVMKKHGASPGALKSVISSFLRQH